MALLLLILIGVLMGWFGSIALRIDDKYAIRRLILIALGASLVVGLIANGGGFIGSLGWVAAGAAVLASVAALTGYQFYSKRKVQA
ncbi:MAG: hypothetical protein ACX930_14240 [Erythrobacter sp.]